MTFYQKYKWSWLTLKQKDLRLKCGRIMGEILYWLIITAEIAIILLVFIGLTK